MQAQIAWNRTAANVRSRDDRLAFWACVLMLILLPIERIYGPASLRPADAILIALTLYSLVKAWHTHQRLRFPLITPMLLILIASLTATAISGPRLGTVGANLIAIVQEIYLYSWFVALVNLWRTIPSRTLDRLLQLWAAVAAVEAGLVLMGMLRIGPAFLYTIPYRTQHTFQRFGRGLGTYINPNAAGSFLAIGFFVTLAAPLPRWLRVVLGGWIFLGMYGTGSNGAMGPSLIALLLALAVYAVQRRRQRALLGATAAAWGIAAMLLLALVLLRMSPSTLTPLVMDHEGALSTSIGRAYHAGIKRLELADWAQPFYAQYPWGAGPNSFGELEASLHNDYLAFLFERGPLGLIGWLLIVIQPLYLSWKASCAWRDNPTYHWQTLALGAAFLSSAANMFLHELSHTRPLWLLMALILVKTEPALRDARQTTRPTVAGWPVHKPFPRGG